MCETAAQICCYFTVKYDFLGTGMVGFGGLDDVRFREPVVPGDRLVMVAQMLRIRPKALVTCRFQGFMRQSLAVEGELKGVPIPVDRLTKSS